MAVGMFPDQSTTPTSERYLTRRCVLTPQAGTHEYDHWKTNDVIFTLSLSVSLELLPLFINTNP